MDFPELKRGVEAAGDRREKPRIVGIGGGEVDLCLSIDTGGALGKRRRAAFAFAAEIRGVRHALAMLGERQIQRWFSLVAFVGAGQDKSRELIMAALVRARFCESLASHFPGKPDLFVLGLFSLMDALLDMPMWEVLTKVPVATELKNALLRRDPQDKMVRLLNLIEAGKWEQFSHVCGLLQHMFEPVLLHRSFGGCEEHQ